MQLLVHQNSCRFLSIQENGSISCTVARVTDASRTMPLIPEQVQSSCKTECRRMEAKNDALQVSLPT